MYLPLPRMARARARLAIRCKEILYEKEIESDRQESNLYANSIGIRTLQFDKNG